MTKEQQRIKIAEACGWKKQQHTYFYIWLSPEGGSVDNDGDLPNYPADLNAMHEAKRTLSFSKRMNFVTELRIIIGRSENVDVSDWCCVFATAEQEAEAFLKTLGLWEEGE